MPSYDFDGGALVSSGVLQAWAQVDHAIMRAITTKAYLLDKDGKQILWQYDEGVRHEKNGFGSEWWEQ